MDYMFPCNYVDFCLFIILTFQPKLDKFTTKKDFPMVHAVQATKTSILFLR